MPTSGTACTVTHNVPIRLVNKHTLNIIIIIGAKNTGHVMAGPDVQRD